MTVIIYWIAMTGVAILVVLGMAVKNNSKYANQYEKWYSIALVTLLVIAILTGSIYNN